MAATECCRSRSGAVRSRRYLPAAEQNGGIHAAKTEPIGELIAQRQHREDRFDAASSAKQVADGGFGRADRHACMSAEQRLNSC